MARNEAKIKFTAETGEFNDAIKSARNEMSNLKAEMQLNDATFKNTGNSAEYLQNKHKILAQELEANQQKQEALNGKIEAATAIYGADSAEVLKLNTELTRAQTEEQRLQSQLSQTNEQIRNQGVDLKNTSEKLMESGNSLMEAGKGATAMSVGIAAFGKESVDSYNQVVGGAQNVIKATGATGEEADALREVYKDVSQNVIGDFDSMGSAVGEVATRFGFTDQVLQDCSEQFLRFSKVTGVDATNGIRLVSRYMNSAGIEGENYSQVLDQITAAAQGSGISAEKLLNSLVTAGPQLKNLGYTTEEQIALLSQFELAGVDLSAAMMGMKKAVANWSKEGKDASTEWQNFVQGIQDGSVTAEDAIDLFGSKAGVSLYETAKAGKLDFSSMMETINGSAGTINDTMDEIATGSGKFQLVKQRMTLALSGIGESIMDAAVPALEILCDIVKVMGSLWEKLPKGIQTALVVIGGMAVAAGPMMLIGGQILKSLGAMLMIIPKITGALSAGFSLLAANPIVLVVVAIVGFIAALVILYKKCETFRNIVNAVFGGVKTVILKVINTIKAKFEEWKKTFETIKIVIQNFVAVAKANFQNFIKKIKPIIGTVKTIFSAVFKAVYSLTIGRIVKTVNGIKAAWAKVKGILTNPIEAAKSKIKGIINKIKGFFPIKIGNLLKNLKLPHFRLSWGSKDFGKLGSIKYPKGFSVKWYAKAMDNPMILHRPTIFGANGNALLGGGDAGDEVVSGADTLMRMIQNAVATAQQYIDYDLLAKRIVWAFGESNISLQLGKREVGRLLRGI